MIWRFSILDRNNVTTVIDEPVGWDANVSEIKRDPDWHGIFFNNQGDTFEFYGQAMELIKKEKELYGVEGNMTLIMEENCGLGFEEFSRGRFNFSKYEDSCGDSCYVKIPIENVSEIIDLRNRINQKVNLETTKAFDEVTDLTKYDKLPATLELPSKGIFIQDNADTLSDSVEEFQGSLYFSGDGNENKFQIEFGLPDNQLSEIGSFSVYNDHNLDLSGNPKFKHTYPGAFNAPRIWPLRLNPLINYSEDSANFGDISNPVSFDILLAGKIENINCYIGPIYIHFLRLPDRPTKQDNGEEESDYEYVQEMVVSYPAMGNIWPDGWTAPGAVIPFNFIFKQNLTINKGDRFYLFMSLEEEKTHAQIAAVEAGGMAYRLTLNAGSHIKLTNLSHTPATETKVFAINEVISRVSESITNNRLRAYSEYFGRTDSQPYALPEDGCGSLEVIADGIRIRRQENKIPDQTSVFAISLQDIFNGLNPIHNIGMGIEPDSNRTGFNRLRVEPWKFFYNDTVVMSCTGVNQITRKTYEKDIYSTFQFGYNKWEAEEYNGLDEFLTKRNYRTTLSRVKNDLIKLSTFIASGYAIEITRRKGNTDSKDWRYDKDTFIICVKRGSTSKFLIQFNAPNNLLVAVWGDDYSFAQEFFTVGGTININSPMNSGTFTITAVSNVPGNLSVTVSQAIVNELALATVSNNNGMSVELGNVSNPVNIIDPNTLYNYRISPVRNAMRWMNRILESYKQFDTGAKIIFTDGDGNYFASGEMSDGGCKLENTAIAENVTVDPSLYTDSNDAKPFMTAERVTYEYPMSSKEYKTIEANPYGLIYFENECDEGLGWIDTVRYIPEDGLASFNLIPAIDIDPTGCVPVAIRGDGTLPGGLINIPYSAIINLYGTGPFVLSNIVKPSWMTITVSGTTVYLSGIPTDVAVSTVSFKVSNCDDENQVPFSGSVDVGMITCEAVAIPGTPALPDGFVNTAYNYSFPLTGDGPFALSNMVKPDWMSVTIVSGRVVFSGTPTENATGIPVSFDVSNCSGTNTVSFADALDITTLCIAASIAGSPDMPNALVSFAYNYSINIAGTGPFTLSNIVKPSWMTIDLSGSVITFSGTPDVAGTDIPVSLDVDNCAETPVSFADTINVVATDGGSVIWGDITGDINDQTDLIGGGKILPSLLPALAITDTYVVSSEAEMLALGIVTVDNPIPAETGDICVRTDETKTYILKGTDPSVLADWEFLLTPTGGVVSIFGRSGAVTAQSGDYSFSLISGTAGPTQGGTGLTSYAKGDLIYASAVNVLSKLAIDTVDGKVLTTAGGVPVWSTPSGGLPSMTGNGGKFLTNNGTVASWANVTASVDTSLDYTWTGKHIFSNVNATVFGANSFITTQGYGQSTFSAQFGRTIQVVNGTTDSIILSGDPTSFLKIRRNGSFEASLFNYSGVDLTVNPLLKTSTSGMIANGLIKATANLSINKPGVGEQGIIFWNAGNGNRHSIVHSNNKLFINTCDAGGTPDSTVGFNHIVLVGDNSSSNGVTQQTIVRSASNGFGPGVNTVSAAACLEVTNYPTLNFFGIKIPILTTKDRDVVYQNSIPSGSNYSGAFVNGSANISTIQNVVIQAGDIISIRVTTVAGTEVSRAIIVSADSVNKTAVMDRPFSGVSGTYFLPYMRTPSVPNALFIFNSDLDAPQIRCSTGWKTFNLT